MDSNMDPNAALTDIRELAEAVIAARKRDDMVEAGIFGEELATAINDLDEFLSKEGFLPIDWVH